MRERNDNGGALADPVGGPATNAGVRERRDGTVSAAMPAIRPPRLARQSTLWRRVRAEYDEMPGLTLTLPQAVRLFNVAPDDLEPLLLAMVREGFLVRGPGGTYRRTGCPRCS